MWRRHTFQLKDSPTQRIHSFIGKPTPQPSINLTKLLLSLDKSTCVHFGIQFFPFSVSVDIVLNIFTFCCVMRVVQKRYKKYENLSICCHTIWFIFLLWFWCRQIAAKFERNYNSAAEKMWNYQNNMISVQCIPIYFRSSLSLRKTQFLFKYNWQWLFLVFQLTVLYFMQMCVYVYVCICIL